MHVISAEPARRSPHVSCISALRVSTLHTLTPRNSLRYVRFFVAGQHCTSTAQSKLVAALPLSIQISLSKQTSRATLGLPEYQHSLPPATLRKLSASPPMTSSHVTPRSPLTLLGNFQLHSTSRYGAHPRSSLRLRRNLSPHQHPPSRMTVLYVPNSSASQHHSSRSLTVHFRSSEK